MVSRATDEDDIDGLAAEYVLGSLSAVERAAVERRRENDAALAAAIDAWEHRLAPLGDGVPPVQPPPHLLRDILRVATRAPAEVVPFRAAMRSWRWIALVPAALAACLLLAVAWDLYRPDTESEVLVAELSRDTSTADEMAGPAFMLTIDMAACRLTARPLALQPRRGRAYQLWMVPGAGPPSSLGVLTGPDALVTSCPAGVTAAALMDATIAVSQEPGGGSPTGLPTGPLAYTGKLSARRN